MKNLSNQSISSLSDLKQLELVSRELLANRNELAYLKEIASKLDRLNINRVEMEWLQVLSEGWAYPLSGFMREDEYLQSLHFNCIKRNGMPVNRRFDHLDR